MFLRRLVKFVTVGSLAAVVHWFVVVALVTRSGWHPALANVLGWFVAFHVSFAGHHRLTFSGHGASTLSAAARFLAISASAFLLNEVVYVLLLWWTPLPYQLALAIVLVGGAVMTYAWSRHWAFPASTDRPLGQPPATESRHGH